jgi:hypothetical protein
MDADVHTAQQIRAEVLLRGNRYGVFRHVFLHTSAHHVLHLSVFHRQDSKLLKHLVS